MANINNKLFAYTYAPINDAALLEQYKNSLIFIGKEQQIYQPLTNTYIGIGKSEFEALQREISEVTGNQLSEVVSYINKTNTGMITAQYSQNQFVGINGANPGKLGTYNSQLYQGSDLSTTSNEVVIRGANQFTGLNDDTITNLQNVFSKSGINVSIQRGTAYTTYVNPLNGEANVTYFETSYLTIDDAYTWAHIADEKTYITNYAQKVAVDQANRVYKNLLGINDDSGIFIEKQFNEAFSYNVVTGDLATMDGRDAYVKLANGTFQPVTINNINNTVLYGNTVLFKKDENGKWRPLNGNDGVNQTDYSDFSFVDGFGSMSYYNWDNDGQGINEYVPVFYQKDTAYTAYSNIDLADGINTIREIAYILDIITDGTEDSSINLTYNIVQNGKDIQELKDWADSIGANAVTSITATSNKPNDPNSKLITLTQYSTNHWGTGESTGDVVIETKLNVAKVIPGRTYTKEQFDEFGRPTTPISATGDYAIYDPSLLTLNEQFVYSYNWVYNPNYSDTTGAINTATTSGDTGWEDGPTYVGGWFSKAAWDQQKHNYVDDNDKFYADGSDKVWIVNDGSGVSTISNLQNKTIVDATVSTIGNAAFIYIPWQLPVAMPAFKDGVLDALTDVRWVTAYVNSTYELLNNRIQNSSGVTQQFLNSEFEKRAASYAAPSGKYFTSISQENGILSAYTIADLPTDYITDDTIITTYGTKVVKVSGAEIVKDSIYAGKSIYANAELTGTTFDRDTLSSTDTAIYYVKFNDVEFTEVSTVTDFNESIYVKDGNAYMPVSIQQAFKDGGIIYDSGNNAYTVANNVTYYYAPASIVNDKYLDSNSIHIDADGSNRFRINAHITYIRNASETNTGFADAYDVRKTIEDMFTWIDLRTNAPFVAGA